MATPFDDRLNRILLINSNTFDSNTSAEDAYVTQNPFSTTTGNGLYNVDAVTSGYSRPGYEIKVLNKDNDSEADDVAKKLDTHRETLTNSPSQHYTGVASIMNPFAFTRLYGSEGGKYLVDTSTSRKYYEIDGDDKGHYAKNPTTSNIIKWGASDKYGRHAYQYQDFVFCKYWNVIPNNRMITLRRFTQPTYDNMNFPTMDDNATVTIHPVATAVTYFGEGTNNTLSDLLKFSAKMGWKEETGTIWEVQSQAPSMESLNKATNMVGWGKFFSTGTINMATVLGLVGTSTSKGNENFDFDAAKGLPPDPYNSGPYSNRVLGPINKINKVWRRNDEGLTFTMDSLKLKFEYVARPIGGINPKAVLLDLLSNFLVLGYASGVWWGGSHRFQINPTMYPFNNAPARQAMWKGNIMGKDGAAQLLVENYKKKLNDGLGASGGGGNIFRNLADMAAGLMGDLFKAMKWKEGGKMDAVGNWLSGRSENNAAAKNMQNNVSQMVAATVQARVGPIPYLDNMKSLLTGEPVGDWHLVIGNPMNPIAEIGNLICKNISITFSDELGPDDFPIGFTAEIELAHGIGRDRDGIEAMFNKGAGRIYELPDKYSSSADGQTIVDAKTHVKGDGSYRWTSVPAVPAQSTWSTKGQTDNTKLENQKDAYKTVGAPGFIDSTINLRKHFRGNGAVVHPIMPWQTKIVL